MFLHESITVESSSANVHIKKVRNNTNLFNNPTFPNY